MSQENHLLPVDQFSPLSLRSSVFCLFCLGITKVWEVSQVRLTSTAPNWIGKIAELTHPIGGK